MRKSKEEGREGRTKGRGKKKREEGVIGGTSVAGARRSNAVQEDCKII